MNATQIQPGAAVATVEGSGTDARTATEGERSDAADGRRRLLAAAAAELVDRGAAQISLRAIARRAGLSHNAAAHHFGDRSGLLTAVATDGFEQLTRTLDDARTEASLNGHDPFGAIGAAYLDFGLAQPALLDLMFRPDLLRASEPALAAAQRSAFEVLEATATSTRREQPYARQGDDVNPASTATRAGVPATDLALVAWSFVHGLVGLTRYGALGRGAGGEVEEIAHGLLASFGRLIGLAPAADRAGHPAAGAVGRC